MSDLQSRVVRLAASRFAALIAPAVEAERQARLAEWHRRDALRDDDDPPLEPVEEVDETPFRQARVADFERLVQEAADELTRDDPTLGFEVFNNGFLPTIIATSKPPPKA